MWRKSHLRGKIKWGKFYSSHILRATEIRVGVVISVVKKHCINNKMVFVLCLTHNTPNNLLFHKSVRILHTVFCPLTSVHTVTRQSHCSDPHVLHSSFLIAAWNFIGRMLCGLFNHPPSGGYLDWGIFKLFLLDTSNIAVINILLYILICLYYQLPEGQNI